MWEQSWAHRCFCLRPGLAPQAPSVCGVNPSWPLEMMSVEGSTITSRIKNLLRSPSIKLRRSKPGNKREDIGSKVSDVWCSQHALTLLFKFPSVLIMLPWETWCSYRVMQRNWSMTSLSFSWGLCSAADPSWSSCPSFEAFLLLVWYDPSLYQKAFGISHTVELLQMTDRRNAVLPLPPCYQLLTCITGSWGYRNTCCV